MNRYPFNAALFSEASALNQKSLKNNNIILSVNCLSIIRLSGEERVHERGAGRAANNAHSSVLSLTPQACDH